MDAKVCKRKGGAWDANRKKCYDVGRMEMLTGEGLRTDGGHHKQWYLEEIAKKLGIDIEKLTYFEKGIAP